MADPVKFEQVQVLIGNIFYSGKPPGAPAQGNYLMIVPSQLGNQILTQQSV
jgi:hypothetical protein